MVTSKHLFFISILLCLVVVLGLYLFPSKEKRVKKQLNNLTEYASKKRNEPTLKTLTKTTRISGLFAENCILKISNPKIEGNYSRKEIMDRVNRVRNSFSRLKVSFYDITIHFTSDTSSVVLLTMRLLGKSKAEEFTDVQEVKLKMQEIRGKWLISGIELVDILER
ncbi:MAG TPA: hypothetical protein ENK96_11300 [Desulfobulbaceae bacterium]|nr:hypothetical protein [Desulfobulbaceae bacterium]